MGNPTVPIPHKAKLRNRKSKSKGKSKSSPPRPKMSVADLLEEAAIYLQISRPDEALSSAQEAYSLLLSSTLPNTNSTSNPSSSSVSTSQQQQQPTIECLPAISLLGDIYVELGEMDQAKHHFLQAIALDPDGSADLPGGGAEKFLWMAQLCEQGGAESIEWFTKGANILRRQLQDANAADNEVDEEEVQEKTQKLGSALCGIAEVYMTDLSFDDQEAEQQCEAAISEALALCPTNPDVLQTLASIRISQLRQDEARAALSKSLSLWIDLAPEDPAVPAFPTRISLMRMLLEVGMLDEATGVSERLVLEDDGSVEAWYLGGWAYWLAYVAAKEKAEAETANSKADASEGSSRGELEPLLRRSRRFLQQCLKLYTKIEYEDEQLRDHAVEIMGLLKPELEKITGAVVDENEEEEDEWEVDESDDDGDDMMDVS